MTAKPGAESVGKAMQKATVRGRKNSRRSKQQSKQQSAKVTKGKTTTAEAAAGLQQKTKKAKISSKNG